jgi:hypothetical protein
VPQVQKGMRAYHVPFGGALFLCYQNVRCCNSEFLSKNIIFKFQTTPISWALNINILDKKNQKKKEMDLFTT